MNKLIIILSLALSTMSYGSDMSKVDMYYKHPVKKLKTLEYDPSRTVVLDGVVESSSIDPIINKMEELSKESNKKIYLIINSPGGEVPSGNDLVNEIKHLKNDKNLKVICGIYGLAASMAADISTVCYQTYMQNRAEILFHKISTQLQNTKSDELNDIAAEMSAYSDILSEEIAYNLGMDLDLYLKQIDHKDWLITAKQAAEMGMIDGTLDYLVYEKPVKAEPNINDLMRLLVP